MGREREPPQPHRGLELEPQLEALVSAHFLAFIREAHETFGDALGVRNAPRELPDTTALAAAVNALSYAIAEYGRLMVGELDREDPASVERFRRAMAPLDHHRATARRGGSDTEEVVEPSVDERPADVDPEAPASTAVRTLGASGEPLVCAGGGDSRCVAEQCRSGHPPNLVRSRPTASKLTSGI